MADVQLFSNNARSTLAAESLAADTTIELVSSAGFSAPAAGQYELATLTNAAGTLIEIVKITDNSANVLTVERAQEGTAALDWPVGTVIDGRVTAGTLSRMAQGFHNGGNARGQFAINLQSELSSPAEVATGYAAITLGVGTRASSNSAVAIGTDSHADAPESSALWGAVNRLAWSVMSARFSAIPMDDYSDEWEQTAQAPESVLCSPYLDLAVPSTWSAGIIYHHGDIVIPTTPDGFQYRLWTPDDPVARTTKQVMDTTGATEPVWPASLGSAVAELLIQGDPDWEGQWICQDPTIGYTMQNPPEGSVFFPTQFGFLCHDTVSTLTGTPVVSIGVVGDTTRYVSMQNVSISVAHGFHLFTSTPALAVQATEQLLFTLDTPATAGRCVGRFFAKGFFVELPDHG